MADRAPAAVAVVGLGLIGGSVARALVARGVTVHGTDASDADRRLAAAAGVRVADDLPALAAAAPDVVLVAVPPAAVAPVVDALLPLLPAPATVLHAAGLQDARALGLRGAALARTIGTHPLAGSHGAGFAAARADLFAGAVVWAEERADAAARAAAEWLWRAAGAARVAYRAAGAHDAEMAWVSHLPQLVAVALAATLAEAGVPRDAGGPGLRDATRLAASPLPLWRDLLRAAPPETTGALCAARDTLDRLGDAIARGDDALLIDLWTRAQAWRAAPGSLT